LWIAGFLIPAIGLLALVGVVLTLIAGISYLVRPRTGQHYWRGRPLEVGAPPSVLERLYRLVYRR
jgi:hypothetical protein